MKCITLCATMLLALSATTHAAPKAKKPPSQENFGGIICTKKAGAVQLASAIQTRGGTQMVLSLLGDASGCHVDIVSGTRAGALETMIIAPKSKVFLVRIIPVRIHGKGKPVFVFTQQVLVGHLIV